jgi:Tfp pilus assembly protein PilX
MFKKTRLKSTRYIFSRAFFNKTAHLPAFYGRGFVLVTVLLLLVVITIVVMGVVENSLLISKMGNNYAQKIIAFYKAESALKKAENDILQDKDRSKYRHIQHECGVDFYVAEGNANFHGAEVNLQSTVAVLDKSAHCQPQPQEAEGRQEWFCKNSNI